MLKLFFYLLYHDFTWVQFGIVIILHEIIYIKNMHGHIDPILFIFLMVFAPNMHKLLLVFFTLWLLPILLLVHHKYPSNLPCDMSK